MTKIFLTLGSWLALMAAATAGIIIDDFSAHPNNTTVTFSAPNLGRNPTFLRQPGLDAKHVLGGNRSASLFAESHIPLTFSFDAEKKLGILTLEKLATGRATLSYLGGNLGEARDLDTDFTADGAGAIVITFASAPTTGTLAVTVYSKAKFQTFALPIKGTSPVVFPFTVFKGIDFQHIDGVTLEVQTAKPINKKLAYEISRIETASMKRK